MLDANWHDFRFIYSNEYIPKVIGVAVNTDAASSMKGRQLNIQKT